uniref:Rac GTPase-activating protein 1-like n=1 Tax=Hirondellea gigas TaxID=1518452 RepID=A0A2P2I6F6_9CRUS
MATLPPSTPVAPRLGVKAEGDDMVRALMMLSNGAEKEFLSFCEQLHVWLGQRMAHRAEVSRLQGELLKSEAEVNRLEKMLKNAQHLLGLEKEKRIMSENQLKQIFQMMEKFKGGGGSGISGVGGDEGLLSLLSSTLEQGALLGHLNVDAGQRGSLGILPRVPLSTIDESADTLDAVSDIDLTEGDELDVSSVLQGSNHKRRRSRKRSTSSPPDGDDNNNDDHDAAAKRRKRRSSSQGRIDDATAACAAVTVSTSNVYTSSTPTISHGYQPSAPPLLSCDEWPLGRTPQAVRRQAPLPPTPQMGTPHSQYSTPPQNSPLMRNHLSASRVQNRPHCFYSKTIYMSEHCQPCGRRIKFGKLVLKCRDCRAVCHQDCRDAVPVPCVPTASTPGNKHYIGSIADFTPSVSPMVPALIVHCTIEVEQRGCTEVGVYRVNALDRDVKELKEKFLRGKGLPNLNTIDIHVVCGTVKNFIRNLKEPLITHSLWHQFVNASDKKEEADREAALYQCISELPQPNRDTLAWIILHLQRMSEMTECLMTAGNFAKVFGPTVIGYSVYDPEPQMVLLETASQQNVMANLLSISRDYWENFIHVSNENLFSGSVNIGGGDTVDLRTPDGPRHKKEYGSNRRKSLISRTALK